MFCIQKTKGSTVWFSRPRTYWHWCGMIRWLKMYHPEDRWLQHRKSVARMEPQRHYLYLHWTMALNTDTEHWHLTLQLTKRIIHFWFKSVGISIISKSWILKVVEQSMPRKCVIFWSSDQLTFLDSLSSHKNYFKCVDVRWANFWTFYWPIIIQIDTNCFGSRVDDSYALRQFSNTFSILFTI